tara:strand:+ start:374 stop:868 length:495 start_codon:yes stop_codon:yes gene_type:complete
MQRTWNYLLYSTWRILCHVGLHLIEKPLIKVFSIIPFFRKNIEKGKEVHRKIVDDRNLSFSIAFAYSYMFYTTMIIYTIIFLYLFFFFQIEVGDNLRYWFYVVVVLSYCTNQILSWRNDKYLKYFAEFDNLNDKAKIYLPAVLFHLGVFLFAALSIHWTIGYNF